MKLGLTKLYIFLAFAGLSFKLLAIPATPYPVKITQPDGSTITVQLRGDEHFNYKTTVDGYPLIEDNGGYLNYAKVSNDGTFANTSVRASDIQKRTITEKTILQSLTQNPDLSQVYNIRRALHVQKIQSTLAPQKAYPLNGSPKSLVILVNFKDVGYVTSNPKTAFTNLLNQTGYSVNGGTGSANDYFKDSSNGVFNPQFDVVGPFTLPNNEAVYGANNSSGDDVAPAQMVVDACIQAAASGVDFSQYDTDKDGIVDNVFIYYAGYNEAEGAVASTIWPHRWGVYPTSLYSGGNYSGSVASVTFNGVRVMDYACTSELRSNAGANMCGVGTFCHEFGHVLGLDDMYNTNGDNSYMTLETFDVMDYGPYLNLGRTPPSYSAYERFYLNWLTPTELKTAADVSLLAINTSNKAYLLSQSGNHNLNGANPNPAEFFLLENRQNTGWDTYFGMNPNPNVSSPAAHGLYISHIFYNASTWSNNTPNNDVNAMGVSVVRADGIASIATLTGDLFPGKSNVTQYKPLLRAGTDIKKPLFNIKETNGIIQFHFKTDITLTSNFTAFSTVQGTPSSIQTITVSGAKLKNPITISFKTGTHYEMKKTTDLTWNKTLNLIPVDSVVAATTIQIRYNPTVPSYTDVHSDSFVASTIDGDYEDAALTGSSTRAVYVVPPVASAATEVTHTSFIANWNNVFDAVGYYVTAYSATDGTTTNTQGFDNGLTPSNDWAITATGTSTQTSFSGQAIPSILFQNTGEYVLTEKYLLPVTSLSFYVKSVGAFNGGLLIKAQNNQNNWEKVDSIPVTTSLSEPNKTYAFTESKGYTRFKFTYYKGTGNIVLDDVTSILPKKINYILQNEWVTTNSDTLSNLKPGVNYYYKLKASDRSIYYENITNFSNIIAVNTLGFDRAYLDKNSTQIIYRTTEGSIIIMLAKLNSPISIYNAIGKLIKGPFTPTATTVEIKNLTRGQFYIVKIGTTVVKVVL